MQFDYYNNSLPAREVSIDGYTNVAVIVSFKNDGKFIPLKFQIEIDNERFSFDTTVARTVENKDTITYHCYYMHNGCKTQIELIYLIKNHIWITPSPNR